MTPNPPLRIHAKARRCSVPVSVLPSAPPHHTSPLPKIVESVHLKQMPDLPDLSTLTDLELVELYESLDPDDPEVDRVASVMEERGVDF